MGGQVRAWEIESHATIPMIGGSGREAAGFWGGIFPIFRIIPIVFNAFQAFKSTKNFRFIFPDTSISMSMVQFPSRFFNLPGRVTQ